MTKQTEIKKEPRHGFINELAKICGCSRHTVRRAIYENAQSEKADRVRKVYNAKYKKRMKTINCDTEFRTSAGEMVQTFDNGVVLVHHFKTNKTGVYIKGELKDVRQGLDIDGYTRLQMEVQEMRMI